MTLSEYPPPSTDASESTPSATRDTGAARQTSWSWVPIRSLGPRHRGRILAHLLALEERARYLRFGFPATDSQLSGYVDRIDFDKLRKVAQTVLATAWTLADAPDRPRLDHAATR